MMNRARESGGEMITARIVAELEFDSRDELRNQETLFQLVILAMNNFL
jgi:hypothetical protein